MPRSLQVKPVLMRLYTKENTMDTFNQDYPDLDLIIDSLDYGELV